MDTKTVTATLPENATDLAEMVGNDKYRLMLVLDLSERTIRFEDRLRSENGVTEPEFNGHVHAYRTQPMGEDDAESLVDAIMDDAEAACNAYDEDNMECCKPANLDRANTYLDRIERTVENYQLHYDDVGQLWDARDWLENNTREEILAKTADQHQEDAHDHHVHVYGLDEYLAELATDAAAEAEIEIE